VSQKLWRTDEAQRTIPSGSAVSLFPHHAEIPAPLFIRASIAEYSWGYFGGNIHV
jgi:hypothetical protein